MSMPELAAEDRDALRNRLVELRQAVAEQPERLRQQCARSDAVGIERVEWTVPIKQIAEGNALLGLDPQGGH